MKSHASGRKGKQSLGRIDLHLGDVSDAFFLCNLKKKLLKVPEHCFIIYKMDLLIF